MVEAWFDFDEISKLEDLDDDEAEQLCDDSTPDTRPTLARPDAPPPFSSLEGSTLETEHLVPVDDRANGVLYIVQFTVATTPQELYKELAPGGMSCKTELGLGRTLVYLPNGVCMAMEEDPKRSLCPVRREYVIHQTKCGRTLSEARKVDTWEGAVARPLLRFRTVWELKAAPDGKSTRVRCNLSEFEQCQRQELDLAELVIASKDQEILRLLQKFGGADASPPSDYLVFSAPATAELLKAASEGNAKALPRILAKRADPNFTCEPAGYNGELTPLMAAVRAGARRALACCFKTSASRESTLVLPALVIVDVNGGGPICPQVAAARARAPRAVVVGPLVDEQCAHEVRACGRALDLAPALEPGYWAFRPVAHPPGDVLQRPFQTRRAPSEAAGGLHRMASERRGTRAYQ
eukprot:CAMPEP_0204566750 /NCGR_PEP_ID=MMETSP0661-20131031/36213_1 /ASSEMBLY_ACC=CAM_ASM_000606 /TAXON_ID=109239 /ORGANISM="Alexandrium margalefi, Strain AMGDE01CS-322" /LENGTH=408 /DNA_ID=CAMNT_0051574611 /DNA_START=58 /DNA_END=1282 /DNA_ORIENTATION=-